MTAALARHHQQVGLPALVAGARQQAGFGPGRQIPGQQHRARRGADAQHATVTIVAGMLAVAHHRLRTQHLDDPLTPGQPPARQTGHEGRTRPLLGRSCLAGSIGTIRTQAVDARQCRGEGRHHPAGAQAPPGGLGPADMSCIQMRQHQPAHLVQSPPLQPRQQHALDTAAPALTRRAGIVEQTGIALLHQHHAALADVERRHHQRIVRCLPWRRQQHRQQAQQPQPWTPQPRRRQQQHRTQQGRQQAGQGWCRQHQAGQRQAVQPVQHLHQPVQLPQQGTQQPAGQPRPARRQQHHGDRHRRQHEADPRDGQRIGQGPDQRPGREEGDGQRRQQHGGCPLVAHGFTQPPPQAGHAPSRQAAFRQRLLRAPDQRQHGTEGQPEPRLRDRPGVERHDDAGRQQHRRERIVTTPPQPQHGGRQQHEAGALRRHAPARQGRIAEGRQQAGAQHQPGARAGCQPCRAAPGHAAGQATVQPLAQRYHQHRQQRDVHPRDGHQVTDAGAAEQRPLSRADGRLIAQRQPGDDAQQRPA